MNRRDFAVRAGAMAFTLGVARGARALAASTPDATAVRAGRVPTVLFDERFESCRAFAAGARRLGCPIRSIAGDVTTLWLNELEPMWARGEGTVMGMTTPVSLFCLEQLARNHWMRVTARIEHRPGAQGTVSHRLELQEPTMRQASAVLAADSRWPARLAAPLLEGLQTASRERGSPRIVATRFEMPGASLVSLVTWAITPRI